MPIEPLIPRTMPEVLVEKLRRAIFDGTLAPGSQLLEIQLARTLAVSRAPLREALHRLEAEGFVVKIPYKGAFVAGVDPHVADEIARLRQVLEPYATEQALVALQSGPIHDQLMQATERMHEAARRQDAGASIDGHLMVHRLIYQASGNSRLLEIWRGWETHMRLFLAVDHRGFENLDEVATLHENLIRVIESGDVRRIAEATRMHIGGSMAVGEPSIAAKP